ncbi:DUF3263 domain-containing protein [Rhodococcus aetherivorans]|uniref:DUF3263 domain-containing protein n=1 Tax=Rhodococcus aetherivorans TaxID=191292 RepID=UPI0003E2C256|nr:DUF3263 domain-containing protein [Rhodococcus aetherivorans]ETT27286.1 Protein of unknown function DUF3263 [Rhodococcus rhodochrous ATCC 21198]NGP26575.1 DUF3263 domain-containing protein [Rhodococcus aetherivorans]WFS10895.1 DUF3263 domain-containing protein [Rhodococcus aetherivorans]
MSSAIEDNRIIEFARRRLPYGGGSPGDLLVEFGMTPADYLIRLGEILDSPVALRLHPRLRADLRNFVAARTPAPRAAPNRSDQVRRGSRSAAV